MIPCYNEEQGVSSLVKKLVTLTTLVDCEIILVNNGSLDNTGELLDELTATHKCINVVHVHQNLGYGGGILTGLSHSTGNVIGWTHADLQADPIDIVAAISEFEQGRPRLLVKGSRFGRPRVDKFFTDCMSVFETALFGVSMSDINAQPTLFSRALYDEWQSAPGDFALDLFAYHTAITKGYDIVRIPVRFGPRKYGKSSWNNGLTGRVKFIIRTLTYSFKLSRAVR